MPAGPYSCDTLSSSVYGGDPRFISYANFLDGTQPTSQSPFKPYSALQNQDFNGWGIHGNVTIDLSDDAAARTTSARGANTRPSSARTRTPRRCRSPSSTTGSTTARGARKLRLNGEFGDGLLEYTLGGFYMDQDGSYTARVDLNYAGIDFIHGPDTTPSTSKALFVNVTLHPTDRWSITGGLRRSWDEKTYTYFRRNPDGTVRSGSAVDSAYPGRLRVPGQPIAGPTGIGNTPNCLLAGIFDLDGEFKGKRWDWRVVTDYRFSDALLAYASIATGFKGGGVNPRPFFGPSTGECPPFRSTRTAR